MAEAGASREVDTGRLEVLCRDSAGAEAHADSLAAALRDGFTWGELAPRFEAAAENDRIVVDFVLADLVGTLRDSVDDGIEIEGEGGKLRIDP